MNLVQRIATGIIIGIPLLFSNCPTPNPDSHKESKHRENKQEKDVEKEIILKAADRILQLQNANGSWDVDITYATGPTENTNYLISGMTGKILLDAYNPADLTNTQKYLNGAKRTGNYLVGTALADEEQNASNISFLHNLYNATGDVPYKERADTIYHHIRHDTNALSAAFDNDGTLGLSEQELFNAYKNLRGAEVNPDGGVICDLFDFIEAGQKAGDTTFVNEMTNIIKDYLDSANYTPTTNGYVSGLSAGILGLNKAGLDYSDYLAKLIAAQKADGHFENPEYPEGHIDPTQLGLKALGVANKTAEMNKAADYLVKNFGYSGYNGWLEEGAEFSYITSGAGDALLATYK